MDLVVYLSVVSISLAIWTARASNAAFKSRVLYPCIKLTFNKMSSKELKHVISYKLSQKVTKSYPTNTQIALCKSAFIVAF